MNVWFEKPRRHPDCRHKASGRTTVWSTFQNFAEILSCRPDDRTLAARNFHIKASRVWTIEHVVRMIDLMHTISIYVAWASGPWRLVSGRLDFECTTCLMDESVRTGIHIVRTVAAIFPYLCFGKKFHSWSNTEWRPDMLLKRPDGCKLEQFEASWHRGRSGRKVLIVRTDDAWIVECLDGTSRHPDGCKGSDFTDL